MKRIDELNERIFSFKGSGKEPEIIYVGTDFFIELKEEYIDWTGMKEAVNVFRFHGLSIIEKEDLNPFEIVILTKEEIKKMDFDSFIKALPYVNF